MDVVLPALTSGLALLMALALLDQWRERRHAFQLVWAVGMGFFGVASGCEAIAAASGWSDVLYRTWYLAGAVLTAGWLGLGTAVLLGRTRFGYAFAVIVVLGGVITVLTQRRSQFVDSDGLAVLYLIAAVLVALAIAVETYFQNERWPLIAGLAMGVATVLAVVLTATVPLAAPGYHVDPATGQPQADLFPGALRLLTPLTNFTGAMSLALGALFSAYVFMPKRRVLPYSLDPNQSGDQFLFNFLIAIVALPVNFVASLPGALVDLVRGRLHSRVPATLLIAAGAFTAAAGDTLNRLDITGPFAVAKFIAVVLLLAGFLVSIEAFREFRVPFTGIRLGRRRHEAEPETT